MFENYVRAWNTANFSGYFLNTIIYAGGLVVFGIIFASMSGYVIGRYPFPGRKIVLAMMISTLVVPTATTIIPVFNMVKILGLLNTRIGMILASLGGSLVFNILLFSGFFQGIPDDLEDAAKIDGCNFVQQFIYIMFPLSKPIIATVTILNFINGWKAFLIPLVFTFSRPGLRTLGVGMYAFVGEYSSDWTGMAAGASISIVPMMIVFFIFQRYFIEGLAGAIKG
jgi:raffinose/stachyose/melibiose transport system permease protein